MKRILITIILGALLLSACGMGGDIEVHEPWARAALQGENSAVYLMLHNHSNQADELVGVSSEVAEAVEVHLSQMGANGEMQMSPQTSVPLAAGEEVMFQPGEYHIMLVGIKQDLKVGDHFQVVLHFKTHADITVDVIVQELEGMDMSTHTP
jgi:copper(I)-binding protein